MNVITHDEERDIYGSVYVNGKRYFLLEDRPTRPTLWQKENTVRWLVCDENSIEARRVDTDEGAEYITIHLSSYIVFGTNALVDLLTSPITKKVVRFYLEA